MIAPLFDEAEPLLRCPALLFIEEFYQFPQIAHILRSGFGIGGENLQCHEMPLPSDRYFEIRRQFQVPGFGGYFRFDPRRGKHEIDDDSVFVSGSMGSNGCKSTGSILFDDGCDGKPGVSPALHEGLRFSIAFDGDDDVDVSGKPGFDVY